MIDIMQTILEWLALLFVLALGVGVLAVMVLYVVDRTQTTHAIRRNYPVIGRFRYVFETLGEYFRQYFFAMDREEMPFNRAQRSWVYRSAKGVSSVQAFGSTRDISKVGTVFFGNAAWPILESDLPESNGCLVMGEGVARTPWQPGSFFNISAMSYGSISKPAVRALSKGAAKAGIWLNTGEGGLSEWHLEGGCDVIFQMGTAKYGVRDHDGNLSDEKLQEVAAHDQVRAFEIKLSQGAKPGKGGILPAAKVTEEIARVRGIPQGKDSISPNRFPEVDNAAALLDFVGHVRDVTGKPTGIKFVLGNPEFLDEICAEIVRRGADTAPDFITLDSGDGGTGAAPMSLMDNVGLPLTESLPITHDALVRWGLKDRIRLVAAGKLLNPTDVAWALCAGADFVNCARGFMFALGCIQALQCDKNTCPTGITTHNAKLQRGLVVTDKAERVARFAKTMRKEVEVIAHSIGVAHPSQLTRQNCRVVQADGRSCAMAEIWPQPEPGSAPQLSKLDAQIMDAQD
ncbi:MAG: FMN-binding glutamate synthase family protein [Alphaproteobacteria bacterium]